MFQVETDSTGRKVYLPSFAVDIPSIPKPESIDKAFRMPKWNCYCCQDKGYVSPHLMRLVCPEYQVDTHPTVQCQCLYSKPFPGVKALTTEQCKELDQIAREQWHETARTWQTNQHKLQEMKDAIARFTKGNFSFSPESTPTIEAVIIGES